MHPETKKAMKAGVAPAPEDPRLEEEAERRPRAWPQYQSHKVVSALKIAGFKGTGQGAELSFASVDHGPTPGQPEDAEHVWTHYDPLVVDPAFLAKHNPTVGDYVVRYADGYLSVSPAEVFDAGYTPLNLVVTGAKVVGAGGFSPPPDNSLAAQAARQQGLGWPGAGENG